METKRLEREALWENIQKIKNKKEREKQETAMFLNRTYETAEPEHFGLPTLEIADLPSSIGKANVILNAYGIEYNLEFHAGFIGMRQNEQTLALRPEISWIILDTGLRKGEDGMEKYATAAKEMLRRK